MGAGGDGGKVSGANDIQNLERVRQVWGVEAPGSAPTCTYSAVGPFQLSVQCPRNSLVYYPRPGEH